MRSTEEPTKGFRRVPLRGLRRMSRHKSAADPLRQRLVDLGWHAHHNWRMQDDGPRPKRKSSLPHLRHVTARWV